VPETAVDVDQGPNLTTSREAMLAAGRRFHMTPVRVALAFTVVGVLVHLYRLRSGPDAVFDELAYTRAGYFAGHNGALSWGEGTVFIHPPLSFLAQAVWLRLHRGMSPVGAGLFDTVYTARLLDAFESGVAVGLTFVLGWRLGWRLSSRRRYVAAGVAALITTVDPVMVHYGRQVLIEPFALCLLLAALLWSLRYDAVPRARWILVMGLLAGLCLLTKELTVFWLVTPAVAGALSRNWGKVRAGIAAVAIGIGFWVTAFLGWSIWLGQLDNFSNTKFFTLERLLGIVQSTGLNRSSVSPVKAIVEKAPVYAASYLLIACGGLALLVLIARRGLRVRTELIALLLTTYAFAGYTVVFGQFNEQFFFYVIPPAAIGVASLLVPEAGGFAAVRRLSLAACVGVLGILSIASYVISYVLPTSEGFEQLAAAVETSTPECALINTSGEIEAWQWVVTDRDFVDYGIGPTALRQGVFYYLLSPTAAENYYPNMSPSLATFITSHAVLLHQYPSREYGNYGLFEAKPSVFDPTAGVSSSPTAMFVATQGNDCGGFTIDNSAAGAFYSGFQSLGGKAKVGDPASRPWSTATGGTSQLFSTLVLTATATASSVAQPMPAPVIRDLAMSDPSRLAAADIPVPSAASGPATNPAQLLTNTLINRAYFGDNATPATNTAAYEAAQRQWGAPLTAPQKMADGSVRQSFANVVFEVAPGASTATLDTISPIIVASSIVPATALQLETPSSRPPPIVTTDDSQVWKFLTLFAITLGAWLACWLVVVRRSRSAEIEQGGHHRRP
jgi:hypothetical protein